MVGLIGKKIGMTQVFNEQGILVPVTIIQIDPNWIVAKRTPEKNGYQAVVLGSGELKPSRVTKPYKGQFPETVQPTRYLVEIKDFELEVEVGSKIGAEALEGLRFVDVRGTTKGKGFQGVMKRWGFHGGRSTHGSKFHRTHGSTGQNTHPGHTFAGVKMAGRMGGARCTVQNLRVVKIDTEKQLILVRGAVPGTPNGMVVVTAAKKREL
ncbi:MAG: 50S ribosomal protein L3 [Spirochaetales bacterium]